MLVCSQNDISLMSDFACLFSHFYCIQVFNYMCWLKLLTSSLCGLSDLSDTVCLQVKTRLQDAQWHQLSYIPIPTIECNQLLHFC